MNQPRTIPFGTPILGEEEKQAVLRVLDGPILVHGPVGKAFERDFAAFTRSPHAIAVANCTAGMHLTWFHLGLGPGDDVLVSAMTHTATAHAVALTGARPVFVDAETHTGNLDLDQLEASLTPNTRAVALVHYLGVPVNMTRLMAFAQKHNLFVMEDCALAMGTFWEGVHAGLHGDAGAFSFYPVKHMTTAEGGMVITRHDKLARGLHHKRAFGVDRPVGERTVPGVYDVADLGLNYRLNELQCALGVEQLKRVPGFLARRRKNFAALAPLLLELAEVQTVHGGCPHPQGQSSHYCAVMVLKEGGPTRDALALELKTRGVGTSVYYPRPVPHFSYYQQRFGAAQGGFPGAARLSQRGLALPVGPHLNEEDMGFVAQQVKEALWALRQSH